MNSIFKNKVAVKTISGARFTELKYTAKDHTKNNIDTLYRKFDDVKLENETLKSLTDLSILTFIQSKSKSLYLKVLVGMLYLNDNKSALKDLTCPKRINHDFNNISLEGFTKLNDIVKSLSKEFDFTEEEILHYATFIGSHVLSKDDTDAEIRMKALMFRMLSI